MKRALLAAGVLLMLASAITARGRGNVVRHFDDRGMKEFLASGGSCRHHVSAHPDDLVCTPRGWVRDVTECE